MLALDWLRNHPRALRVLTSEDPLREARTRDDLLRLVRLYRDGWEALTSRNQDLGDPRLADESNTRLRSHLREYSSVELRAILAEVLGRLLLFQLRR